MLGDMDGEEEKEKEKEEEEEEEEEWVELKFRLIDGSDIGPCRFPVSSTVAHLKDSILARWPQDNKVAPKTVNDVKIISAGKILENGRTVGQCRMPFGELQKGAITMHVLFQPSIAKTKTEKKIDKSKKQSICSCSIL